MLGDSPRDPKPSPRMLELIRLAEEANERIWRERQQHELENPHADHDYPVTAA